MTDTWFDATHIKTTAEPGARHRHLVEFALTDADPVEGTPFVSRSWLYSLDSDPARAMALELAERDADYQFIKDNV